MIAKIGCAVMGILLVVLPVLAEAAGRPVFGITLLSPIGQTDVSRRVEMGDEFAVSTLAEGKTGKLVGEAAAWRLEKSGALVFGKLMEGKLRISILRVTPDTDGTAMLVPLSVEMPLPIKGKQESVNLRDGSILTFTAD